MEKYLMLCVLYGIESLTNARFNGLKSAAESNGLRKTTICVRITLSGHAPMKSIVPANPNGRGCVAGSKPGSIPPSHPISEIKSRVVKNIFLILVFKHTIFYKLFQQKIRGKDLTMQIIKIEIATF